MNRYLAVGLTVVAGAALVEAALIPGVVIGGAAVLAPRYLPKLRRGLAPLLNPGKPAKPQSRAARPTQAKSAQAQSAFKLPVAIPGYERPFSAAPVPTAELASLAARLPLT